MTIGRARDEFPIDHSRLVERLNRENGTEFVLNRVFEGGEFGAAEVIDPNGRSFVLKQRSAGQAAAVTELLSGLGYPAPRYVVVGPDYSVQEKLPGDVLPVWAPLHPRIVERVLELNELHVGRAPQDASDWPAAIVQLVFEGVKPWIDLDLMRSHSIAAASLLARCQKLVSQGADHLPPPADIMHFDFGPANILAERDEVSGVIDWEGVQAGDRLFDLATLLFYSPDSAPLRKFLVDRADDNALAVYVGHLSVRQTAWSIRFHGSETGTEMVERCNAVLDTLG